MKPTLKKLLAVRHDQSWFGGTRCKTCKFRRLKEINEDIVEFARAKKRGHPMPWNAFVRMYLVTEYKIDLTPATLRSHARKCLKIEV